MNYWGFRSYEAASGRSLQSDPSGLEGGVSTYAYALNNPLRNVDPLGLWVCDMNDPRCISFSNGLQSVQDASTSGNLEPYQQAALANVVSAYGAEGDPSVQISFGALPPGIKGRTTGNGKGCETITFDSDKLVDGNRTNDQWAATIAHEGQHVADDIEGNADGARVSTMDTEVNAYTVQAYYDQAMRYAEANAYGTIWTFGGGINYFAIQNRAAQSVIADNGK